MPFPNTAPRDRYFLVPPVILACKFYMLNNVLSGNKAKGNIYSEENIVWLRFFSICF